MTMDFQWAVCIRSAVRLPSNSDLKLSRRHSDEGSHPARPLAFGAKRIEHRWMRARAQPAGEDAIGRHANMPDQVLLLLLE